MSEKQHYLSFNSKILYDFKINNLVMEHTYDKKVGQYKKNHESQFDIQLKKYRNSSQTQLNHNFKKDSIVQSQLYRNNLEQKLLYETKINIQNIIIENNKIIETLTRKNTILIKHLQNINFFFTNKFNLFPNNIPFEPVNQQNIYTIKAEQNKFRDKQFSSSLKQKIKHAIQEKKRLKIQKISKIAQNLIKQQSSQYKQQQQGAKKMKYCPSIGPVRYAKQSWTCQQKYVKQFLNGWMRKNMKETPEQLNNKIQKRIILQLYMKWKDLRGFVSELQGKKIQQIITNEMKILFKCRCTRQKYVGVLLHRQQQDLVRSNIRCVDKDKGMNRLIDRQCVDEWVEIGIKKQKVEYGQQQW